MARVRVGMARSQAEFDAMSARRQAQLDQFQAQRDRMEARRARVEAQIARMRIPAMTFNSVEVAVPNLAVPDLDCPRLQVRVARPPTVRIPAPPVIHIDPVRPGSV